MRQRVLSLVDIFRARTESGHGEIDAILGEGEIIDLFGYSERRAALQRNAGRIIDDAIANTPERYEDVLRREVATTVSQSGPPRELVVSFFKEYIAPLVAKYADSLEAERFHLTRTALTNARTNSGYRRAMMVFETMAKRLQRDPEWTIERKVLEFLTQERWEERYVPILRKYME